MQQKTTLAVIVGNRNFFPDHLCEEGRPRVLKALEQEGIDVVVLPADQSNVGAVETLAEARRCGDYFKRHADTIDGVLVTLPNFGDERAVSNTIRFSGLDVPVLVHAFADDPADMSLSARRDSFCGKMSCCNNLRQYNIPFSLTSLHTCAPESPDFRADLRRFAAVCRVVRALDGARVGQLGARPAAFNTVRYSEKLLESAGISVEPLDLSEALGQARRLDAGNAAVKAKLEELKQYTDVSGAKEESLMRMACFGAVIEEWMAEHELDATAVQCWTSLEENYGIVPCGLMSMMSEKLLPSACETDVCGVLGMLALQAASGTPAALLDWNNNYGDDPDKGMFFHCSNLPKSFFEEHVMSAQDILAATVGRENSQGTITGRIAPGPFSFCRLSTDDFRGEIIGYTGEGKFTGDKVESFGGYGVFHVNDLQRLLKVICANGFEHHVALTRDTVADAVTEALDNYLGWEIHRHH